jgi:hypothetical protein
VPAPAPGTRFDGRNDNRVGIPLGTPQGTTPAGVPMPGRAAPAAVAVPPANVQSPSTFAPAQPSLQRAPTRPQSIAPAYVAPPPVSVSPSMPPVNRQAPVALPAPQVVRPAPAPVPQVAPVPAPAPAAAAAPAGTNLQRADRPRADKVDTDRTAPK